MLIPHPTYMALAALVIAAYNWINPDQANQEIQQAEGKSTVFYILQEK
jgi:hypothetical protein